jgi:hypothetical protein
MYLYIIYNILYVLSYYNLMGPPSYMRSVVDRNVFIRRTPVFCIINHTFMQKLTAGESALFHCIREIPAFGYRCRCPSFRLVSLHIDVTSSQGSGQHKVLPHDSSCYVISVIHRARISSHSLQRMCGMYGWESTLNF